MKRTISALFICTFSVLAADAPPNATTVNATELRAQPDNKATAVMTVPAQSNLLVGDRQGAWYKTTFNGKNGWIRMLSIKLLGDKAQAQRSGLADLAAASKGTKSNVGTGIRGLTTERLQKAEENPLELAKLENYAVDADEAQTFARSGGVLATKSSSDKE